MPFDPREDQRGPKPLNIDDVRLMLKTQRDKAIEVGLLMDQTYKMFSRNRRNGRQRVPYVGTRPPLGARSPAERHGHGSAVGFAHGLGLGHGQGSSSSSFGGRMMDDDDDDDHDDDYGDGGGEYKSSSGGG